MTDPTPTTPPPPPADAKMLDELERLDREATPGPWHAYDGWADGFDDSWDVVGDDQCGIASMADTALAAKYPRNPQANAEFIAAARNALPSLIATIRTLVDWKESALSALGLHTDTEIDIAQAISDIRDEGRGHFHSLTNAMNEVRTLTEDNRRLREEYNESEERRCIAACALAELQGEVVPLREVAGRLPVTADGVHITPGMRVWHVILEPVEWIVRSIRHNPLLEDPLIMSLMTETPGDGCTAFGWQLYSTREAALAAAERKADAKGVE